MSDSAYTSEWLTNWVNGTIHGWLDPMESGDFVGAAETAITAIREHCSRSLESAPVPLKRYHFGARVVLNGLRDLANVKIIVADGRWIDSPPAIEAAWDLAHDARERLVGYTGLDSEFLTYCLDHLSPVFDSVNERFGPGLYTSWETLWDFMACSICNADIRGCDHIPGEWYGEQECKLCPEGPHPQAIALVQNPRDPRCRIWPWLKRREEDGHHVIEGIPIFMIFNAEGDDDGGVVVDTLKMFGGQHLPRTKASATGNLALDSPTIVGTGRS